MLNLGKLPTITECSNKLLWYDLSTTPVPIGTRNISYNRHCLIKYWILVNYQQSWAFPMVSHSSRKRSSSHQSAGPLWSRVDHPPRPITKAVEPPDLSVDAGGPHNCVWCEEYLPLLHRSQPIIARYVFKEQLCGILCHPVCMIIPCHDLCLHFLFCTISH